MRLSSRRSSYSCLFLASLLLKEPALEYRHSEVSPFGLVKDGLHLIKSNGALQRILILSLLSTPFINYLLNFYPPYFVKANVSGVFFGAALAVASLLGVFTSKYAYCFEKSFGVKNGIFLAVIFPGLFYFLLAFVFHSIVSIILFILAYGSMHIQKPIFLDYLNRHIQSKNRATVISLINGISGFYVAIMGLLIGFLADKSLSYSFIFMGGLIAISAFFIRIDEEHVTAIQISD